MRRPDWDRVLRVAWEKGPVALGMAPTTFPLALWYFESVIDVNRASPLLAFTAGFFSFLAGLALDVVTVRIATGTPTHPRRILSLTTWVPVVIWLMICLISYDRYSQHSWAWSMSTLVHLAFPTASFAMAVYWAFSHGYEERILAPLKEEKAVLQQHLNDTALQLRESVARESALQMQLDGAGTHASAEIDRLVALLSARESEALGLRGDVNQLRDQIEARLSELHAFLTGRDQIFAGMTGMHEAVKQQLADAEQQLRERERQLAELRGTRESSTPLFTTIADGIKHHLDGDPDRLTTEQLAELLAVPKERMGSFRSQVSQVRAKLREAGQAARTA